MVHKMLAAKKNAQEQSSLVGLGVEQKTTSQMGEGNKGLIKCRERRESFLKLDL